MAFPIEGSGVAKSQSDTENQIDRLHKANSALSEAIMHLSDKMAPVLLGNLGGANVNDPAPEPPDSCPLCHDLRMQAESIEIQVSIVKSLTSRCQL